MEHYTHHLDMPNIFMEKTFAGAEICESFLPRKFLTMQYLTAFVTILCI